MEEMEEMIQRTSSQTNAIDATNNNNNNNNVIREIKSNSKPPILPKPQIIKIESSAYKVIKSKSPSPGNTSQINCHALGPKSDGKTVQNGIYSNSDNMKILNQKPPYISPKPHLPPKINSISSPKTDSSLFNKNSSSNVQLNLKNSPFDRDLLRSPKPSEQTAKYGENKLCCLQNSLTNSGSLPKNILISKQKSNNLGRNDEKNWTAEGLIEDADLFCKKVEKCSKHSYLLQNNVDVTIHSHVCKMNSGGKSGVALNKSDENGEVNTSISNETTHFMNKYNSNEMKNNKDISIKQCSSNNEEPKSFLHRYVNSHNSAKETIDNNETLVVKNENMQSFLHKYRDHSNFKYNKSKSVEQNGSVSNTFHQCSVQESINKVDISDKEQLIKSDNSKKSDNYLHAESSSNESTPFSKRFPWFGSFGKGGTKKDSVKKGRCLSQFYSSSNDMDTHVIRLREKNRTKSLPDIKQTRAAADGNFTLKNSYEKTNNANSSPFANDYTHSDSDDDKDSLNQIELALDKDCNTRAYLKARELMTSEEVFIDVLKLLNVDFRNYVYMRNFEARNSYISNNEVDKILNHLPQLQSLNEDILEDLRKRIQNWDSNPKISDVIVKKGAFLKMYTTYIQNFEAQTSYLDECMVKYPKFGRIVKDFEASDRCKKLTLKHYMLKPVQRIPQYRLLLNDYLKHLDENSEDYADTLRALKIVCEVVDHANRNLAHGDKEGRLMHFQSILSDYVLIKPGRELLKDGPLEKICRKSVKDRYFILLNDCFLHTTYSKQYLKIHQELPLSGMKVYYNDDQKYLNSFSVHSIKRSFILCAKTEAECKEWVEKLQKAIEEHIKKQKTFLNVKIEMDNSFKLGKEAPVWVPDSEVTMCQICTAEFTALFRRHHCRGCGKVVCKNCGSNQAPMQYTNFKPDRVCDQCFDLLLKDYEDSEASICNILKETFNLQDEFIQNEYMSVKAKFMRYSSTGNCKKPKYIPPRLKEVRANDSESAISGWLYRKSRKSWKMFWFVLKDHVLYVYKASEDVLALETIPVLGYEVERVNANHEDFDKKLLFSLIHPSQSPLIFRAESQSSADRWFDALTAASNFDYMAI